MTCTLAETFNSMISSCGEPYIYLQPLKKRIAVYHPSIQDVVILRQEVILRLTTEPAGCTGGNAFHFETWHGVTHCIWHEFKCNNPQKIKSKCNNTQKIRSKWNNIDIISIVILPSDRPKIDPSKCQPGHKQVSARRMFKIILARHIQETVEDHQLRNT